MGKFGLKLNAEIRAALGYLRAGFIETGSILAIVGFARLIATVQGAF